MKVREWMTPEPVTVMPDTTVAHARSLLDARGVRHMPVVSFDGRVVGMLSDRDVAISDAMLRSAVREHDVAGLLDDARTVDTVMSPAPQTVGMDAPIDDAARVFVSRRINALPVIDDGRLVGILTTTDCLLALLRDDRLSYE